MAFFSKFFQDTRTIGGVTYKGDILIPSDFPTLDSVQDGDMYRVLADVTDNDPTRTDTGQSFLDGDEIYWDGANWALFGSIELTSFSAIAPLSYNNTTGVFSTSIATNKLVGRYSASTGVMQEISLDPTTLSLSGAGVLTAIAAAPSGAAGGDLTGTYPNPTVAKINGATLGSTTATSGNILIGSGSNWVTRAITGDITIGSTGITAIGANKVTNTMLRQSAGLSVIARSAITTGDVADITAASDFQILSRSGSSIGFSSINLASANAVGTSILPNANTTATSANTGDAIIARDVNGDFYARKANLTTLFASADGNIAGNTTLGVAGGITLDQKLMVRGVTNDITGPHWAAYTTLDTYPVYQQLNWAHDIIAQNFDSYWNGATWKSSSSSSNFQLYKFTNQVQFNYASSVAAGSTITWNAAGYIDLVTGTLTWNKQGKFNDTTDSTSISTGGITTLGGLGVAKNITATSMVLGSGNSALRFTNSVVNRKIELYRTADNDHQYYGFGINNGVLRYQTDGSSSDHIFYSGINTTTSLTLLSIKGTGVINIPGLTASSVVLTDGSKNLTTATVLPLANGGTNAALTASNGGIFYSTATAGAILAGTATTNQLLISGASSAPAWTSRYIDYGTGNANVIGNLFGGTGCGKTGITQSIHSTAFGINALASIPTSGTTGSNTAFGYSAGTSLSNANAIYNTFIGSNAGFYLTTGGRNTFIGFSTANSGAFATQNNCTLLGSESTFSADNLSNAMALGYAASVGTDNTIVLGNSSVTRVTTSGSLGLGTTFVPQFKVEAVGGIASTDGATSISQKQMVMRYDTVNNRGDITCIHQGTAFKPIVFQCDSIGITNGSVPGTPTGFYAIYVTSGALKGKGTSGTITNIGNADPHCKKCGSDFGLGWEHPRYGGQVRICEICRSEYDDNLRKCILYIANDNKAALADMQSFLSEEPSYIVWNVDRDDEYKNIRIPLDIGRQMADEIDAKEAAENAAKSLMQAIA